MTYSHGRFTKYKTIYLVTPTWHGNLPQPVRVLLEGNSFSGKTNYVFGIHLGSGFADNIATVKKLCPGAKVVKAKAYYGDAANSAVRKNVTKWLSRH